ncbi:MAG: thymidylate synthase [Nanoarchaeota archaeon]
MKAYLDIVKKVLREGKRKLNRTGTDTFAIAGVMFEHDMSEGFPLLTTKSVPFRLIASELEFFIKGMTDKEWLQEQNNHIWDEWCTPLKIPYSHDPEVQEKMKEEKDLGPIYGYQWRNFDGAYIDHKTPLESTEGGIDQLKELVKKLKEKPEDRRMIVTAYNPKQIKDMALPPCHYGFQVTVIDGKLNLMWNQRSVDVALGLPFNIASYGLLLHLLAKESGFEEGRLVGFLGDTHIYENHVDGMKEQLKREPYALPTIKTEDFTSIFEWKYQDTVKEGYMHHPKISFKIAV